MFFLQRDNFGTGATSFQFSIDNFLVVHFWGGVTTCSPNPLNNIPLQIQPAKARVDEINSHYLWGETMALLGFPSCTEHANDVLLAGPQNQIGFMICFSVWGWGAHMTSIVSIRLSATGWTSTKHIVKHTWMKWYDVSWGLMLNIYKEGLPLGQLNWVVPLVKLQGVQTMWMQYLLRCPRILLNFFKSWCHVLCLTDHFIWYDLILYNIMWYCIILYYIIWSFILLTLYDFILYTLYYNILFWFYYIILSNMDSNGSDSWWRALKELNGGVCVYTSSSPSSTIANIPNAYGCCRVAWSSEPSSAIAVGWLLAVWPIIAEKCVGSSLPLCTLHQLWKSAQCCRNPHV